MEEHKLTWLPLKVLKLTAILALTGVTIWQCTVNIQEYFQYDAVTSVSKEKADSIEFPQVTLCNYNRWKFSLVQRAGLEMAVSAYKRAKEYRSTASNGSAGSSINIYNFTYRNGWHLIDAENAAQFPNRTRTLGSCYFSGQICSTKFFKHRMTSYGNCYTFNQDLTKLSLLELGTSSSTLTLPLKQTHASETNGLQLYIDIEAWDYSETLETVGNPQVGLKVILHSRNDEPDPTVSGVSVGPGLYGTITIKHIKYNNLSPPWGTCNPDAKTTYFNAYTASSCESECKMKLVENNCSCRPYYYPLTTNTCNFEETLGCAAKVIAKIDGNFSNYCSCQDPCTYEEYEPTVSYVPFPSSFYANYSMNIVGIPSNEYMKQNSVGLRIYFSDIGSTVISQLPAHTVVSMLNDLGGTSGLYIGFSFMTIAEFIQIIGELVYSHIKVKKNLVSSIPSSTDGVQREASK